MSPLTIAIFLGLVAFAHASDANDSRIETPSPDRTNSKCCPCTAVTLDRSAPTSVTVKPDVRDFIFKSIGFAFRVPLISLEPYIKESLHYARKLFFLIDSYLDVPSQTSETLRDTLDFLTDDTLDLIYESLGL